MNNDYDIIIVGAGPGGCSCAYNLSGKGLRIAIIDKAVFPREKICGGALSPDVINQLNWIDPQLALRFHRSVPKKKINSLRIFAPDYNYLDIYIPDYQKSPLYTIKRIDFDKFYFDQIKNLPDVHIFQDHKVEEVKNLENEVILNTNKKSFKAKIVVGADGANSIVKRKLSGNKINKKHFSASVRQYFEGVENLNENEYIELHFYKEILPCYFWIFPLPNNQANVGLGMLSSDISKKKINLKEKLTDIIQNHPNIKSRFGNATPLSSIQGFGLPLGSGKVSVSGHRYLLIGDAASIIDPLTGEGIGNAIRSGRFAADHLIKAFEQNRFDTDFNKLYDQKLYNNIWNELRISNYMQKMLRYPKIINFIIKKANKNKSIRNLLTSGNKDLHKIITKPSFYLKLIFPDLL